MAHREKIENAQWSERPDVFSIGRDLILNRPELGGEVAMGDYDAFRLRRSARSEDDFGDVICIERNWLKIGGFSHLLDFRQPPDRQFARGRNVRDSISEQNQTRPHFLLKLAK